ncbi:MAG: hypothetical protein M3441_09705 [Chloroflexota bacterium]|nr:hypothetical protein [Chloroflexota bacterium]
MKQHTYSNRIMVVTILTLFVLGILSQGCSSYNDGSYTPPPPSINEPPVYPGAMNVKVEPAGPVPHSVRKRITFETSDEARKVVAHYSSLLLNEGWRPVELDSLPPNWLEFRYGSGPYYSIGLGTEETLSATTTVTVTLLTTISPD